MNQTAEKEPTKIHKVKRHKKTQSVHHEDPVSRSTIHRVGFHSGICMDFPYPSLSQFLDLKLSDFKMFMSRESNRGSLVLRAACHWAPPENTGPSYPS